jgi:FMN phosphatase YigB (HAD superfamily)
MDEAINTLVFDLGDVLFSWSSSTKTSISPSQLKKILSTPTWHQYECAKISRDECYARCAAEFDIPAEEIFEAFAQARASLTANMELVQFIKNMRAEVPNLRVYAMSNISVSVHTTADAWSNHGHPVRRLRFSPESPY